VKHAATIGAGSNKLASTTRRAYERAAGAAGATSDAATGTVSTAAVTPRAVSVRRKLLYLVLVATVPLVLATGIAMTALGFQVWRYSISAIEARTNLLHDSVDTTLRESIVGYLSAKTETALSTIALIERSSGDADHADESGILDSVERHLLSMSVVDRGYIYVIDTDGRVVIHPDPETQGRVIPGIEPVRTQLEVRNGYMEYTWQNSFEPLPLPKALHMAEYPSRGWIVSATAYREEFVDLIDRERLENLVTAYDSHSRAYSAIMDRDGELIVHPDHPGRNVAEFFEPAETERLLNLLFSRSTDPVRYMWPDRSTGERHPKLLVFRYMPDFDWSIATTIDLRTVRRPILLFSSGAGVFMLVLVAMAIVMALRISRTVSEPIVCLAEAAEIGRRLDIENLSAKAPRELRKLVDQYNMFIDRIDRQQAGLQRSVTEKTVLLHELHHRVKNNLQIVASLLSLQSEEVADPRDAALFDRSQGRVRSMALVHEQLYQTDDASLIQFDSYLRKLIGSISRTVRNGEISMDVFGEPVTLSVDKAIPCGIIVNELVNNACEHAFRESISGSVHVGITTSGGQHVLEVSDSGSGLPEDAPRSLGMTLVHTLTEQIGGTLDVSVGDGTTFRVKFPA